MGHKTQLSNQVLGDLVAKLYSLRSVDERFDAYASVIESLGLDAVCYSFAPSTSLQPSLIHPPIFKYSSQFSEGFLQQYQEDDLYSRDFTIREIQENKLNTKDWKEYEASGSLTDKELGIIVLARDKYGINNAISIPTMKHAIGIAGVSIISYQSDEKFQQLKRDYLDVIQNCTKSFNDIVLLQSSFDFAQAFVFPQLPKITPKENIVLHDLISGTVIKNIGASAKMSQSTVENHLSNLRKKFNVPSTLELKHLLESLNLIEYI